MKIVNTLINSPFIKKASLLCKNKDAFSHSTPKIIKYQIIAKEDHMKRVIFQVIAAVTIMFSGLSVTHAQGQSTTEKFIQNGQALAPLQEVFNIFDVDYTWDKDSKTISISKRDQTIQMEIDNNKYMINGESVSYKTPARLINGKPYIPVRFIGETLGYNVHWDNEQHETIIETKDLKLGMIISGSTATVKFWSENMK